MVDKVSAASGLVFDIQSYSVHDGPGCRTTVFLAGCFLKCLWCANPESWNCKEKIMFIKSKCQSANGCQRCVRACEKQGVVIDDMGGVKLDRPKCDGCSDFRCSQACHVEALKVCGKWYTAETLTSIIKRDREFWGQRGGVTFGGGEPFYQRQFFNEMLIYCKAAYIHTAIETTAYAKTDDFLKTMAQVDFAFIDVKNMDSGRHRQQTGVGNERILHNIAALVKNGWPGRLVLRMPVIQDFNDSRENAAATADFMDALGLYEINILPFHRLGDTKWEQLGKKYVYKDKKATPQPKMEELQSIFFERKIACYIGSDTVF